MADLSDMAAELDDDEEFEALLVDLTEHARPPSKQLALRLWIGSRARAWRQLERIGIRPRSARALREAAED